MRRLMAVVLACGTLAGCGESGGTGAPPGSPQTPAATATGEAGAAPDEVSVDAQIAHQTGLQQCSYFGIKELAETYATRPDPDAIAAKVAEGTPGPPEVRAAARRGCLDALRDAEE